MSLYNPNYIHVSLDVDNFASHEDPIGEMLAVINKEMRIPFKEEREIKAVNGERVGFHWHGIPRGRRRAIHKKNTMPSATRHSR